MAVRSASTPPAPGDARKKAMDYLARREYGRQELRAKLVGAGFEGGVAAESVDQLAAEGLQDDRRFAASFAQSRIDQGKGPVRIRLELEERRIDAAIIDEALKESDADWLAIVREVRRRKFGKERPRDFREKARQMRFLQYRGFEPDHIQAAVSSRDDDQPA